MPVFSSRASAPAQPGIGLPVYLCRRLVCLPVCLSAFLPVCLSCLPVCLPAKQPAGLPAVHADGRGLTHLQYLARTHARTHTHTHTHTGATFSTVEHLLAALSGAGSCASGRHSWYRLGMWQKLTPSTQASITQPLLSAGLRFRSWMAPRETSGAQWHPRHAALLPLIVSDRN